MSTFTAIPFALSVIAILIALAFVLRRNPKLSAELQAEFDKLHKAGESMMDHLHMIHTVASAPVSVAIVPVSIPAPAAEPAPAPVNTSDAVAPNFVAPPAPAPAAAPAGQGYDDYADVIDWTLNGSMGSSLNWRFHGPNGRKTFTVPYGYVGHIRLFVSESPESKGGNGFVCTVNGLHPRQQPSGTGDFTHDIYVGMDATDGDPRDVAGTPGTYVYDIQCEGGGVVNLRHYP